jgi:excisionase family DNA binding protein
MTTEWITTEDAAELSGYHIVYIRKLVREGKVEARKRGSMWWIDKASMETYMARMKELGTAKFDPTGGTADD